MGRKESCESAQEVKGCDMRRIMRISLTFQSRQSTIAKEKSTGVRGLIHRLGRKESCEGPQEVESDGSDPVRTFTAQYTPGGTCMHVYSKCT